MNALAQFESHLPAEAHSAIKQLKSPFDVQEYLQSLTYKAEVRDRSPLNVILDKQCHCLDGGFLGVLLLWKLGFKPLVIDIQPDPGQDDDHVLALFQRDGRWGAVAKTNYVNLGFREAVHKNLRELVMTYFEHYVSIHQLKVLRGYTRPFDASKFPLTDWAWNEESTTKLYKKFYSYKMTPLITKKMAGLLSPVTDRTYAAEIMHTNLNESFGNRKK